MKCRPPLNNQSSNQCVSLLIYMWQAFLECFRNASEAHGHEDFLQLELSWSRNDKVLNFALNQDWQVLENLSIKQERRPAITSRQTELLVHWLATAWSPRNPSYSLNKSGILILLIAEQMVEQLYYLLVLMCGSDILLVEYKVEDHDSRTRNCSIIPRHARLIQCTDNVPELLSLIS